jgi:hypothetical protein
MVAIGLAKETVPGTAIDPTDWISVKKAEVNPVIKNLEDDSGLGIIDRVSDSRPVENTSETMLEGVANDLTLGHLLMACFGTVAAPALIETGVYKHAFTRKNDNNPLTYTFTEDGPAATKQAPYSVLDSLTIEGKAGDYVTFTAKFQGGQIAVVADKTPAFVAVNKFLASGMAVKMATNIAGLSGALVTPAKSFKITIEKAPEKYMALGSTNVQSIHNTTFTVKGDMELIYDIDTILNLVIGGTKQAMSLLCQGPTLIGATKKPELYFELASVVLEDWKRSNDADKLVTQTVGFTGIFSIADTKTISAYLQNTRATTY